jgi:cytosine/adenosine deaminase-related metal-dependent hydrolase
VTEKTRLMADHWEGPVSGPGLIDAHSHLCSTSYAERGVTGATLEEALLHMMAMSAVDTADDVFVACSELLEKGVTGVQMMFHTFGDPSDYTAALAATVEGIRRSGIRALVILGATDQAEFVPPGIPHADLLPDFAQPQRRLSPTEFGDVVRQAVIDSPDITFGVGPVGPQWCSDALLHTIGEISQEGFRVHTHFAESIRQRTWAGDLFGRMHEAGLLGPRTSLAHAVWLTQEEINRFADLGVSLITCPLSNYLLGAGTADVTAWHKAGITVAVGLDSADRTAAPMTVATRSLTPPGAYRALTVGGHQATGVDTSGDRVVWSDATTLTPTDVSIDGVALVEGGTLANRAEVEQARERIAETLAIDAINREARHRELSSLMPRYRAIIEEAGDES